MKIAVRNSDGYVLNGFMIHCEIPHTGTYEEYIPLFEGEDYSEYEISEIPEFETRDYMLIDFYHRDGILSVEYKPNVVCINKEIDRLKKVLSDSDYIVIKSYEATMIGQSVEYNMGEIHVSRQELRDKINELEELLNQEGGVR